MESVSCQSRMHRAERFDKETKAAIKEEQERAKYVPKCPVYGCPDLEKISGFDKTVDIAIWGIWSKKAHKQFKCKACGYEF